MMGKSGWMTGSVLGTALLLSGAALAQTQPRYDYPSEQDHGDGYADDTAAEQQQEKAAPPEQGNPDEDFSDVVGTDEQRAETQQQRSARVEPADEPASVDDPEVDAMIDACAFAAREEAERDGGYAEVRQMEAPRESRRGFSIDGDVETRSGWRAQDGRVRHFTCTTANGRVEEVYFQRERAER